MRKGLISFESPEQFTIADFERIQAEINEVLRELLPFVDIFFVYAIKQQDDKSFHSCSFDNNKLNIHIRILKTENFKWETLRRSLQKIEVEKIKTGIQKLNQYQWVEYQFYQGFRIPLDDYEKYPRGPFFPIFFEIIPNFLSIYLERLNSILNFVALKTGTNHKIVFLPSSSDSLYSFSLNMNLNQICIYVSPNFYFHFKQQEANKFFQAFYLNFEQILKDHWT